MSNKIDPLRRDSQSIPRDVSAFEPLLEYIEESAQWLASELKTYPKPLEALDMVQGIFDIDDDGPGVDSGKGQDRITRNSVAAVS